MKSRKIMVLAICLVLLFAVIPTLAITSHASNNPNAINNVKLTVIEPKADNEVRLDFGIVEVGNSMEYRVVGVNWYKDDELDIFDRLATNDNDKYFMGNHEYTVKIDLEVKGDKEWNCVWNNVATDYSGINATVNGKPATVTYRDINADERTICVVYKFDRLERGVIRYPGVVVVPPMAGDTQADTTVTLHNRNLWTSTTELNWYKKTQNGWEYMQYDDEFEAGNDYQLRMTVQIKDKDHMRFDAEIVNGEYDVVPGTTVKGFFNGKSVDFSLSSSYTFEYTCDFNNVKAKEIDSIGFTDVGTLVPNEGQHPVYTAPTVSDDKYYVVTDAEVTGGEQYGFINGIQWISWDGALDSNDVFESGKIYTLSFFVRSEIGYSFNEWLEAVSDVGYAEVLRLPDDPTLAMVNITFPPCDGGTMSEVNIGGVDEPVFGKAPDYNFEFGLGFTVGDVPNSVVWVDLETGEVVQPTDTFIYGHSYELLMVLKSDKSDGGKFGFAPHSDLTVNINGKKVDTVNIYNDNPEENWVQISKVYECKPASIGYIDLYVKNPIEDELPAGNVSVNSAAGTFEIVGIEWHTEDGELMAADARFEYNTSYYFVIGIIAKEEYVFDENKTSIVINGTSAVILELDAGTAVAMCHFVPEAPAFYNVTFIGGMGTGESISPIVTKGGLITLPECSFTAPEGYRLLGWSADGMTVIIGNEYNVTADVVFTALYEEIANHQHVLPDTYNKFDAIEHWKECVVEGCESIGVDRFEVHNHNYDNDCDTVCNDCGYERSHDNAGNPLHFYLHDCSEVCPNCGQSRVTVHTPGAAATCTEGQKCTVCDKELTEANGHTAGATADCGRDQTCTVCGEVLVEANGEHTPGAEATCTEPQKCTVCGAELKAANGHSAGVEWITDKDGHYKLCGCGERVEAGEHTDSDGDKMCDACGTKMKKGLGAGAIVLIVLGSVAVVGGGGFCLYWFVIKKKKQ